jgi:hypothetical protein
MGCRVVNAFHLRPESETGDDGIQRFPNDAAGSHERPSENPSVTQRTSTFSPRPHYCCRASVSAFLILVHLLFMLKSITLCRTWRLGKVNHGSVRLPEETLDRNERALSVP